MLQKTSPTAFHSRTVMDAAPTERKAGQASAVFDCLAQDIGETVWSVLSMAMHARTHSRTAESDTLMCVCVCVCVWSPCRLASGYCKSHGASRVARISR